MVLGGGPKGFIGQGNATQGGDSRVPYFRPAEGAQGWLESRSSGADFAYTAYTVPSRHSAQHIRLVPVTDIANHIMWGGNLGLNHNILWFPGWRGAASVIDEGLATMKSSPAPVPRHEDRKGQKLLDRFEKQLVLLGNT